MTQADTHRIVGLGVVTKWEPEHLAIKEAITQGLVKQGFQGSELEERALHLASLKGSKPYDTAQSENTITTLGANFMLLSLTANQTPLFSNANAALGVGDSSAAFALGQTNLQGAVVTTNRIRKAMNATYPSVATNVLTAQSTFATTEANFAWAEWGFFNNVTDAAGTMFNRAVSNLGTKSSASAWQLTITVTAS